MGQEAEADVGIGVGDGLQVKELRTLHSHTLGDTGGKQRGEDS